MEDPTAYIPIDRRHALARGVTLPERVHGAALFADISGFTPLTEALAQELGPQRGAEELTRHLNAVYDALIAELECYGGSVIGFSGDAITCWLDGDDGLRATACALGMQAAMGNFAAVQTGSGKTVKLAVKVAIAVGSARRFLVGDPEIQLIDVLAGATMDRLATTEHLANAGDVVLDPTAVTAVGARVRFKTLCDGDAEPGYGVVDGLLVEVPPAPWPALAGGGLSEDVYREWLIPPVYERLRAGQGEFLAELRPAVALFLRFTGVDYEGDSAAGEKLDVYIRDVQHVLARYDGTLVQVTLGDKGSYLYAAFGAPIAHEDDAQRAAWSALELRGMSQRSALACGTQIGLTNGRMRTGAYGSFTRRTYGVLGDAVNLAARLMGAAAPGQIVATAAFAKVTGDAFAWEELPEISVKGKAAPVQVARLTGRREARPLRLHEPSYALPMVGRKAELSLIETKIRQALGGKGQIVGITGEAGLGKSRLLAEVIALANRMGLAGYGGECQSYGSNTSYLVWQNVWRGLLQINPSRDLHDQVRELAAMVGCVNPDLTPRVPLLGAVLNLPLEDNDLTGSLDGKLRKTALERLLIDYLRAKASQEPLFFVLEDCHWLDPLSADLLTELGRAIADRPVLLLLAYRPPDPNQAFISEVRELPYFTEIDLARFTPDEAEQLIRLKLEQMLGCLEEAPEALVTRLMKNAEGNPFYIEELLNYVQSKGISPTDTEAIAVLDLPDTLQSLVLSRIDQVSEGPRAILRVASVVGRVFDAAVLWDVHPQLGEPAEVLAGLRILGSAELTPVDNEPEQTYLFKHILTQEVAYESLPFATRATLHEAIARHLESAYAERLDQFVDLLAHHYDRSDNLAKRRLYLRKAGEAAQARFANAAAVSYYRRLLPMLPDTEQVPVMLKLGKALEAMGQWRQAAEQYASTRTLADQVNDSASVAWCQTWSGELNRKQGDFPEASRWLAQARAGFEALGDEAGIAQALHFAGSVASQQGNAEQARALYEESLALRQRLGDKLGIASLLNNLAIVADNGGDHQTARQYMEQALAIRQETGNKWLIAISLSNLGGVAYYQDDHVNARIWLEQALSLFRQFGDPWNLANSLNNLGNVAREEGKCAEARTLYLESLSLFSELGDKWALAYLLEDIGVLLARCDQAVAALRLVGAAEALRNTIGAPLPPEERAKLVERLAPARRGLSEEAQELAWNGGRSTALEQILRAAASELGEV